MDKFVDLDISDGRLFEIPTNVFPPIVDRVLSLPTLFSLVVLFQGCFGGLGVAETPVILETLSKNPIVRFVFLAAISYTATSDIETALFATTLFFIILHLLRTEEERKTMKHII